MQHRVDRDDHISPSYFKTHIYKGRGRDCKRRNFLSTILSNSGIKVVKAASFHATTISRGIIVVIIRASRRFPMRRQKADSSTMARGDETIVPPSLPPSFPGCLEKARKLRTMKREKKEKRGITSLAAVETSTSRKCEPVVPHYRVRFPWND